MENDPQKAPPKTRKIFSVEDLRARKALIKKGINPDDSVNALKMSEELSSLRLNNAKAQCGLPTINELKTTLAAVFEARGVEPIEELLKILDRKLDGTDINEIPALDRANIWLKLMEYRYPKLKSSEVKGTLDQTLTIQVIDFKTKTVIDVQSRVVKDSVSNG